MGAGGVKGGAALLGVAEAAVPCVCRIWKHAPRERTVVCVTKAGEPVEDVRFVSWSIESEEGAVAAGSDAHVRAVRPSESRAGHRTR